MDDSLTFGYDYDNVLLQRNIYVALFLWTVLLGHHLLRFLQMLAAQTGLVKGRIRKQGHFLVLVHSPCTHHWALVLVVLLLDHHNLPAGPGKGVIYWGVSQHSDLQTGLENLRFELTLLFCEIIWDKILFVRCLFLDIWVIALCVHACDISSSKLT